MKYDDVLCILGTARLHIKVAQYTANKLSYSLNIYFCLQIVDKWKCLVK